MDDDTRDAALRRLREGAPAMTRALRRIARRGRDPEARAEAKGILDMLNAPLPGDRQRGG